MSSTNQFSVELEVFERHRREWSRSHPGTFVAIQDENVVEGFFANYGDALRAGLKQFGSRKEFLIKQVWMTEPVYLIS
jgi:hypothetical protein